MPLNTPNLAGDVSGGVYSTSVDKLKGNAVAATAPTTGQTLVWTGSAWAPATPSSGGGGGANGLTYYLNQSTDADSPTTGIPGTPKQLGRTGQTTQVDVTTGTLTPDTWTLVAGFVSEATPQDPATTLIPAGLWDFNVWALGVADQNHSNSIRVRAYIYNGTTLTALGTSAVQAIGATSQQYSVSMLVEQTTILATDRIYVAIEALGTANGHTVTAQFGDNTPSHVHTSLGLIGGTGLWKNTAGVLQSPASLLVDADVDLAAAIAQSKIAGLTTDLGNKAGTAQVDVYATAGTFTWTKPAGAKAVHVALLSGGGGGGSGRKTPSGTGGAGGGGGMGGSYSERIIQADLLGASETVTVGAGGAGGPAISVNGTNGQVGVAGGNSSFGTFCVAYGANPGAGGTTTSGGGGSASANALRAMFTGAPGGQGNLTTGNGGGGSGTGATGGGGGGGVAITPVAANGGAGGTSYYFLSGGQAVLGLAPGGNGGTNINVAANQAAGGGGGGGGASSITGNAGNGGAGGLYGGGGGGGGGALNDVGNSGAGGNGAQGIVVVTTYF